MSERRLCVLLPGYNVGRYLNKLVPSIGAVVPQATVCLVDDGSADDTAAVGEALGLAVLRHEQNRGKGAALQTGFAWSLEQGFDGTITMDSDGQHLAEEIPRFLQAWEAGAKVVVGSRMDDNENMPWLRKRTNEFTSWVVSRLAEHSIADSQSGYRLFDNEVLGKITLESTRYDMESEILIKAGRLGYSVASVPISTVYHDEKSSINPVVDTVRFFRLVLRARHWR